MPRASVSTAAAAKIGLLRRVRRAYAKVVDQHMKMLRDAVRIVSAMRSRPEDDAGLILQAVAEKLRHFGGVDWYGTPPDSREQCPKSVPATACVRTSWGKPGGAGLAE